MQFSSDHESAIAPFIDEGWIEEILYEVKSGKEATVFCCQGGERSPVPLIAAKVYRPIESRRFKNDGMYAEGRVHMAREGRVRRAVKSKSAFGRQVQYGTWLWQEWDTLNVLHEAGASVPRPLAVGEQAILMPFLGDEDAPAPMLHEIRLARADAARLVDALLSDVELMLDHDCVHGDLSPYNIMYHGGRAVIIDFPQAIDPRLNHSARVLLTRDVEHLCNWARRHDVNRPADRIAGRLWSRFMVGDIG